MPLRSWRVHGGDAGGNTKQSFTLGGVSRVVQRPCDPPPGESGFDLPTQNDFRRCGPVCAVFLTAIAIALYSRWCFWCSPALRCFLSGLFAKAGADVSARNAQQETPLHHACSMMDVAIVALLLHHGADEFSRNINNQTCADVLGHGLDEHAGGERGDPVIRQRTSTMLARAPAERAWRRRSWIVMMRAHNTKPGAWDAEGGKTSSDTLSVVEGVDSTVTAKAVDGPDEKHRCCGTGHGETPDKSQASADVVGTDKGLEACVAWIVRANEEGIFREVVSFL